MTSEPVRPATRLGALFDLAIWAGVLALGIASATLRGPLGIGEQDWARIAAPALMLTLVVVSTVLMRRRGETWRSVGLAPPVSKRRVLGLVVAGYLAGIAVNGLCLLVIFPAFHLPRPNFTAFGDLKGHAGLYAYWLVTAWLSAGVGEELQFRGFLWSRLERLAGSGRWAWLAALVGQAVIFALGHGYQGPAGLIVTGGLGLVLGGVYLAGRRNLVACMVLHALIDTVSLTALFLLGAKGLAAAGT